MISLIRKSAKYLIIETNDMKNMNDYLLNNFNAYKSNIYTIFAKTNENYTVIYLTDDIKKPSIIRDTSYIYMLPLDLDSILCSFMNEKKYNLIKNIKIAPRFIIFKTFGNTDKIIFSIMKDYDGTINDLKETAFNLDLKCSTIAFTEKPLNRNLSLDDLYKNCLRIDYNTKSLYRNLKRNALRYLNEGLEDKQWYEIEIRIYDIYNAYHFHYKRLMHVIEDLELGLVLGESWSKDYPFILMSVGVYSIKFFTFYKPSYIKSILIALEHTDDNVRLCDFDVYYKKKKISWRYLEKKKYPTRESINQAYRKQLFEMLNPESIKFITDIEKETLKSRP